MNYKSNKIFTKCCASILAVSNIFSGVSADSEEKPKKAEDNQLSISKKELGGSILGASGLAILPTLFLSKMIFSANSTDTEEDIEEVRSMALALEKTYGLHITRRELLHLCYVKSCKELLDLKGEDISVELNGNKYIYRVSCAASPYSANPTKNDNLLSNLKYCLFSDNNHSLSNLRWNQKLPFVIHLKSVSCRNAERKSTICLNAKRKSTICLNAKRKKSTVASVTVSEGNAIESITEHTYSMWSSEIINDSSINITQKNKLKSAFYPNESAGAAIINVGYWEKIPSSSSAASSSSEEDISY